MKRYYNVVRYDIPLHFVLLLTNWLPDLMTFIKLRGFLASFFFKKCGKNLTLGRNLVFYNPSMIELGDNVYIAYGTWICGGGKITIGNKVLFGPGCVIASGRHVFKNDNFYDEMSFKDEDILIKDGAWLAANVNIAGGTIVGRGSVIAAGTSIKGSYPDFSVIAGGKAEIKKTIK